MMRILKADQVSLQEVLNRDIREEADVSGIVDAIIQNVRENGDKALYQYAKELDHAELSALEVTAEELEAGWEATDEDFRTTLTMARDNITEFHRNQCPKNFVVADKPGIVMGQRYTPVDRAGVYVPGGTASYPSTVLMDVIPAKLAGVPEIVMVTPPRPDGTIKPEILAAAKVAGVDRIFKLGGAGAVAALAYGTESVPKVDKIVGPGNIFVATAKRKVFGLVDIDMIAGPSEILIVADGGCNPAWVAADLLSQAEHDKLASAVLVTDSEELASAVAEEVERQLQVLPREEIARASIEQNGKIILTDTIAQAVEISNAIAPEHLELAVEDPFALLPAVKHAGSIFMGRNVPEALGDYFAGPNHTLPTSGTARFSSPLGVDDFIKRSSFLYYSPEALSKVGDRIVDFARREGLDGHGRSVAIRCEGEKV